MSPDQPEPATPGQSPNSAHRADDDTSRRQARPRGRTLLFAGILVLVTVALSLVAGEVGLRLYFWGGARRTLGAPGGGYFDTQNRTGDLRAPLATLPREPGTTRVLIQGDSITWGLGIHDWRDIYPNVLLDRLAANGGRYDMAVLSEPGREIDAHLAALLRLPDTTQPDVLVYQWYVNDIEIEGRRPDNTRRWQRWRAHESLKAWSYLYFFLDWRLSTLLPPPTRSYTRYLLDDYKEGGQEWSEFRRVFHNWAVNAATRAPRRIMLIYPTLPFSGAYPLQVINDRMKALAGPHTYRVPVWTLDRRTGNSVADSDSTFGFVRRLRAGEPGGWLFFGPGLALAGGSYQASVRLRLDGSHAGRVGRLEVVHGEGRHIRANLAVGAEDLAPAGQWRTLDVPFTVEDEVVQDLEFRFAAEPGVPLSFDTVSVDVNYGLEILDPMDQLAGIDTRASIFDAHPNEQAHRILAETLARAIEGR